MSLRYRLAAYRDLLHRYFSIFFHFWKIRKSMDGGLFNESEATFLPAALSLQEQPASPVARLTGRVLMLLIVITIIWSIFGKIDIVVNAFGKIIPSGYTKTIASTDVARVRGLHVEEGQMVKTGEVLIELDTSMSDAEHDKAVGDYTVATLQIARSRALIAAIDGMKPPILNKLANVPRKQWQAAKLHLDSQYRDFSAKLASIDNEIKHFSEALPLATRRANDYHELSKNNDVSTHEYFEKEQARIDLEGQLMDAQSRRTALINQTRKEAYDMLTEASRVAAVSKQDARRAGAYNQLMTITAPVDGTVQQLTVHTIGGVVEATKPLMQIVPYQSNIEVEAFIENKDVGFVRKGQDVAVKVDAFEYTKYGTIPAKVTHVSHDAIQDEKRGLIYSVKVTLDKSTLMVDGEEMELSAGMSVNVEIKTGSRRVIEYVLAPLIQHQKETLRER